MMSCPPSPTLSPWGGDEALLSAMRAQATEQSPLWGLPTLPPEVDPVTLVNILMFAASSGGLGVGPLHAPYAASSVLTPESRSWKATAAVVRGWDAETVLEMLRLASATLDMMVDEAEEVWRDTLATVEAAKEGAAFCEAMLGAEAMPAGPRSFAMYETASGAALRASVRMRRVRTAAADARTLLRLYDGRADGLGTAAVGAALASSASMARERLRGGAFLFMAPDVSVEQEASTRAAAGSRLLPPRTPALDSLMRKAFMVAASARNRRELFRALLAAAAAATGSTAYLALATDFAYMAVDASTPAAIVAQVGAADVLAIRVAPTRKRKRERSGSAPPPSPLPPPPPPPTELRVRLAERGESAESC